VDAIVIENHLTVGSQPSIGLKPGGTQAAGHGECFDGVLGGVGAGPAVGEHDRRLLDRGDSGAHVTMVARPQGIRTRQTQQLGPTAHRMQAAGPFSATTSVPMDGGTGTRTEDFPTHGYYPGKLRDVW